MKRDYHGLFRDLLELYESHLPYLLPFGLGRTTWGSGAIGVHVLGHRICLVRHSLAGPNNKATGKGAAEACHQSAI